MLESRKNGGGFWIMRDNQLALYGGTPVRESMLQYGRQWIEEEDVQAVLNVLHSDFLTQGPKISEFEQAVAEYVGARYAVAFCNGTAALHGACFAAGIGKGDEVITTPLTFAATANSVLYQGGTPVFADVDENTYLLDIEDVKKKINERTKAVIPVDFTGQPIHMDEFRKLADEHGLVLIQDGAHSLGASYAGKRVGSVADMTMFSFHPVKPITTGEGGIIVTNNKHYYERLQLFRSHGITREPHLLERESEGPWYYEMIELGYNYRITDLQAALGLNQIKHLDRFITRRREIARQYDEAFAFLETQGLMKRPLQDVQAKSGWHLYIIQLQLEHLYQGIGRREVFEALRAENIGVNVHYPLVYHQPYYERMGYSVGLCPIAERLYESFITLPLFPKMTEKDVHDVVQAVEKVLHFYKR
jgi:perosamine synthetase